MKIFYSIYIMDIYDPYFESRPKPYARLISDLNDVQVT